MNSLKLQLAGYLAHKLPLTRCFGLKRALYKWAGVNIGKNVRIVSSAKIVGNGTLSIGDNTWIGHDVLIVCSDTIKIGANCDIAPRVYIGNGTHVIDPSSANVAGKGLSLPINIGDGCWLCVNSTILPGAKIGNKSIIAAGAIIKGEVPSFELWGGVPAKKIRLL
ncbi:MAG: acyltransferase [Bacteroidales bacterium]|nr:acyltransferase [Bacteroidales bacterium]